MTIFNVLTMIGGLCLFLFGMDLMGQALERRAGGKLRTMLDRMTGRVMTGFLTGLGITAVIQSSSATTVMVVGFVNSGLMTLRQAINVIMGANVGTTVTAWLLSMAGISSGSVWINLLKPTSFTPVLALVGIIFYMFCKNGRKKDTGMILLGFATLMFGMDTMSGAVAGLKDVPAFAQLFIAFKNPVLGVLAGAVLTGIIQSHQFQTATPVGSNLIMTRIVEQLRIREGDGMIVCIQHVSTLKGLTCLSIIYGDMGTANQVELHITIVDSRHHPGVACDIRSPVPMVAGSSSYDPTYSVTVDKTENGSVTVSPKSASKGSTVTITVKPDSGYVLETLTVTDKNGNELTLKDKGDGKYTFTMPGSKVVVEASFVKTAVSTGFADVPADAYFADAVKWAVDKGVTNGLSDTMFGPYESCTRAQIVTFLWRAAGSPEPKAASSFTDVPANAYYAKAVAWAVENGITNGMTATMFAPDATCTRGQSVTFLYRALKGTASGSANFTDVKSDAFYADAINWAVANNVTNGTSNTTFSPNADCTRAEIVTFLYRAYQGK